MTAATDRALVEQSRLDHLVVPFPEERPLGFEPLGDEPTFDPERHLQLEEPAEVVTLADLGYPAEEIATKVTSVAASSPFRMLSDEGAEILLATARRLESTSAPAGDRIRRSARGGCYRSAWLRDLCLSPEVSAHFSSIFGIEVAPHPMPHQLGHLNFAPPALDEHIDKWHHDTLPLDAVTMVTDPTRIEGGRFEYFVGTKHEAAELAERGALPPADRVVTPEVPGPGWTIALHGDMVVHRAARLLRPAERISMVNGYVAVDTSGDDQSRNVDLMVVDSPEALYVEWARYAGWRAGSRLAALMNDLRFGDDPHAIADRLDAAVADVRRAAAEMRAGRQDPHHYGG